MDSTASRRRKAILAGYEVEPETALGLLTDSDAAVRVAAFGALERLGLLTGAKIAAALADKSPRVRKRGLESLAARNDGDPSALLDDEDPLVVETACWALGERGESHDPILTRLMAVADGHGDALCREAAIAALGAIGHADGLPVVLGALSDRPTVRRRAVLALAAFDGPEVEAALGRALTDRDWQVRQAAEDLLGDQRPNRDRLVEPGSA
ncbi:MAG: HEAT repeat domain-containing protein [Actinomycetota bacterium]|nr:HEAT repeat domain-containing protein [Actinomycetota bacterium]